MRKIYIDSDHKCHVAGDGDMREVETDFFDGKCDTYIEGFRFTPGGECRRDPSGAVCHGVSPWKDLAELEEAQRKYEKQMLAEYGAALNVVGVEA